MVKFQKNKAPRYRVGSRGTWQESNLLKQGFSVLCCTVQLLEGSLSVPLCKILRQVFTLPRLEGRCPVKENGCKDLFDGQGTIQFDKVRASALAYSVPPKYAVCAFIVCKTRFSFESGLSPDDFLLTKQLLLREPTNTIVIAVRVFVREAVCRPARQILPQFSPIITEKKLRTRFFSKKTINFCLAFR